MAKTKTRATAKKPAKPAAKKQATPALRARAKIAVKPKGTPAVKLTKIAPKPPVVAPAKPARAAAKSAPKKSPVAKASRSRPPAKPTPIMTVVKGAMRKGVEAATSAMETVQNAVKAAVKSAVKGSPPIKAGSNPAKLTPTVAPMAKPSNGKAARSAQTSTIIPPPAPPRSGKPGKNQAGLSTRELEFFRDQLLSKRRELVGDMSSMEREALMRSGENLSNLPMHMADMGTDNYEQEFTLGLMEKDRQLLREINQALSKIMDGRYGICEGTGKVISKARLEVQPWAKYSIEHARKLENRGVR